MQINKFTTRFFLGLALVAMTAVATPALASSVTFDFTTANGSFTTGSPYTKTVGGLTITAAAWSISTNGNSSNTFDPSVLGQYAGYGFGVCNSSEISAGCDSPEHQVDNDGGHDDYVLFKFSSAVTMSSITLKTFSGNDRDASYWVGSLASSNIDSKKYSDFAGGFTDKSCSSCSNPVTFTLSGNGTYLLFGAAKGTTDLDDYFKIQGLTVTTGGVTGQDIAAVPEPTSMVLLGTGVLGLAARLRRRKQ